MLQALGMGQNCRRAKAGPCKELENRDGIWGAQEQRMGIRAGEGVGVGPIRMQGHQLQDGVPRVGRWCLEHPGEHRQLGKLSTSSGGYQGGVGGGMGALFLLSMPRGIGERLMAACRQGWAATRQVRQGLAQLCQAHRAPAWHWSCSEAPAIYKSHPREKQGGDSLKITT